MWHGLLYNTSRVNCLWNLFYKKHAPWSQICFWKIQCWALLPEGWGIKTGTQSHWTVHNYILKLYVCFSKCPTDYLWCRESDWQDFRPLLHPKFNECAWKKAKNKTERGRINDWAVIKKKKKTVQVLFNTKNMHPHSLKSKSQTDDFVCDSPSLVFRIQISMGVFQLSKFSSLFVFQSTLNICLGCGVLASSWSFCLDQFFHL